jgi:hypothetical protein
LLIDAIHPPFQKIKGREQTDPVLHPQEVTESCTTALIYKVKAGNRRKQYLNAEVSAFYTTAVISNKEAGTGVSGYFSALTTELPSL